jgi:hypothetical protein
MPVTFNDTLTDISDTFVSLGSQLPDTSSAPESQTYEMSQTELNTVKTRRLVVVFVVIAVFVTLTYFVIKSKK